MQSKPLQGAAFKPAPRRCPLRALLRVSRTQVLGLGVLSPLPTLTGAYLAGSEKQQSHQGRGSERCQGRAAVPTKSSSTRASTWSILGPGPAHGSLLSLQATLPGPSWDTYSVPGTVLPQGRDRPLQW